MTGAPAGQPEARPDFHALLRHVDSARADLEHLRAGRQQPYLVAAARHELLLSLEAYAAAAASVGFEVPYRLRLELNLYRLLGLHR